MLKRYRADVLVLLLMVLGRTTWPRHPRLLKLARIVRLWLQSYFNFFRNRTTSGLDHPRLR